MASDGFLISISEFLRYNFPPRKSSNPKIALATSVLPAPTNPEKPTISPLLTWNDIFLNFFPCNPSARKISFPIFRILSG